MASANGSDGETEPLLRSPREDEDTVPSLTPKNGRKKKEGRRASAPAVSKGLSSDKGSGTDNRRTSVNVTSGATAIRKPVHYYSINPTDEHRLPENNDAHHDTTMALNRYKYYNRLAPHHENPLVMPDHVVPSYFFVILPSTPGEKQNSIVTIFSIWNTMMGTSLLSMPWAIQEAGFGLGIGLILAMAAISFYTAYLISRSPERADIGSDNPLVEFYFICRIYMGKWGERAGVIFSLIPLVGGTVVYWVLMSNFLYNVVVYIHDQIAGTIISKDLSNDTYFGAFCPSTPIDVLHNSSLYPPVYMLDELSLTTGPPTIQPGPAPVTTTLFQQIWHVTHTVPFFLLLLLGPLINFKSPTFFTKFNTLGTISVAYIITFVSVKAYQWGINIDFSATDPINVIPMYRWSFLALTGTCSLALFIHNCLLTILGMQKNPENNGRDLFLAYLLVTLTYLAVGIIFYISFPFAKSCIADNLLNNIRNNDVLAFVARMFLLFQMTTVFPLLVYLFRAQFLEAAFGIRDPSLKAIICVNIGLVSVCILFAVFLPNIGIIIRFTGAFCGLAYIFALPCIVYMLQLREQDRLSWPVLVVHSFIIMLGVGNFIGQFVSL